MLDRVENHVHLLHILLHGIDINDNVNFYFDP